MMANGLTSAIGSFRAGTRLAPFKWVGLAKPHNSARAGYRFEQFQRRGRRCATLAQAQRGDDQGNCGVPLVIGGFAPQAVLARMKVVVGGKQDDGVVPQTKPIQSGQHRGARWVAQRLLAIGILEHPAALGQTIDVRADPVPGAVAAQLRPQVVRKEKKHIWLVIGRGAGQVLSSKGRFQVQEPGFIA
jgi:hypothetical protein